MLQTPFTPETLPKTTKTPLPVLHSDDIVAIPDTLGTWCEGQKAIRITLIWNMYEDSGRFLRTMEFHDFSQTPSEQPLERLAQETKALMTAMTFVQTPDLSTMARNIARSVNMGLADHDEPTARLDIHIFEHDVLVSDPNFVVYNDDILAEWEVAVSEQEDPETLMEIWDKLIEKPMAILFPRGVDSAHTRAQKHKTGTAHIAKAATNSLQLNPDVFQTIV